MTCSICNGKGYVEIDSGGVTPWHAEIVDYDFCVCNPRCQCEKPVVYQMLSCGEVCHTCGLRLPGAYPSVFDLVAISKKIPEQLGICPVCGDKTLRLRTGECSKASCPQKRA